MTEHLTMSSPRHAVASLLRSLFEPEGLRRFLRDSDSQGDQIIGELPIKSTPNELFDQAAIVLEQFGVLAPPFFASLKIARPRRTGDIDAVAALFGSVDGKVRYTLFFEGTIDDINVLRVTRLVNELRALSGDDTLIVQRTRPGSILVDAEMSVTGAGNLLNAYLSEQIRTVADFQLRSITVTDTGKERWSPPWLRQRLALIVECGANSLEAATGAWRLAVCLQDYGFSVTHLRDENATRFKTFTELDGLTSGLAYGDAFFFAFIGYSATLRGTKSSDSLLAQLLITSDVLNSRDRDAGISGSELMARLAPIAELTDNVTALLDYNTNCEKMLSASLLEEYRGRADATIRMRNEFFGAEKGIVCLRPGALNGSDVGLGILSNAVAESLARPDASSLSWDDHKNVIQGIMSSHDGVELVRVEGPGRRLIFSTQTVVKSLPQ